MSLIEFITEDEIVMKVDEKITKISELFTIFHVAII